MIDLVVLAAPFRGTQISWRVGATTSDKKKGLPLAYIDARDVMERLDEVCGPQNWQAKYSHADKRVICEISIRIGDEWVTKANGAGDTDVEADKGAISDAFKRAAVLWGIGRYLYGLKSGWVAIEPKGRSHVITSAAMKKLIDLHEKFVGGSVIPIEEPERRTKANSRDDFEEIQSALRNCDTLNELTQVWSERMDIIGKLPKDWKQSIVTIKDEEKQRLLDKQAAA